MAFKDLGDWTELGGLELPISGKTYRPPPVSAELGPRLQALVSTGINIAISGGVGEDDRAVLDDAAEMELYKDVLGEVYAEMVADKVPWAALKHAAMTVVIDAATNRETAEMFWLRQGKSPRPRKRPADRLPKDPKVTAIRTRKASTAGMTSARKAAAPQAQRGRRSSSTGG
jgi:hypothetical protein